MAPCTGAAPAWSLGVLTSALKVSESGFYFSFFFWAVLPTLTLTIFPLQQNQKGLCASASATGDARLCGAAVKVQTELLLWWSCSGSRNLQEICGAQLCLKSPLKDLLECTDESPTCFSCIVIFEGLCPLAVAVWGLFFNIDPYPERKLYRSLDSIHMYSVKNAVGLARHKWWINLLHQEDTLHHVLACCNIFSKLI